MKTLIEGYARIEDYGCENLKITLHNNQDFMKYLGGGGKDITDIVIEELNNGGIKITGKPLIYTAGYTRSRKYIKNMLSRPYSEFLKKDIFGREYVPGHQPYVCPPRVSEKEITYISNHYTIIIKD
jgi:hypothetical protein